MGKRIRDYVKYTKSELENYTKLPGTCVQKINKNIHINFPPYGLGSMKSTLLHIISERKIGSYDHELKGIILDIRNIKILGNLAALRFDDPTLHIDIQADCYVFNPKIGSIVRGLVKHIAAHQISVIIYRVFNVSIRLSSAETYKNISIELNSEIEFRIKNFDLENLMPYIEGELVAREMPLKCLESKHIYLNISDSDSNSNEDGDEHQNEQKQITKVPRKRKKSTLTLPPTESTDDEEIVFSEIFHLKAEEVEKIENGPKKGKNKKEANKIVFSENFQIQPDKVEEFEKGNNNVSKVSYNENIKNKKKNNVSNNKTLAKNKQSSTSSTEDSDEEQNQSSKIKRMLLKTSTESKNLKYENTSFPNINSENSTGPRSKTSSQKILHKPAIDLENSSSSDNGTECQNLISNIRNSEIKKESGIADTTLKIVNKISDNSENSNTEEEIEIKKEIILPEKTNKNVDDMRESSSDDEDIEFKNISLINKNISSDSDSEIEIKNISSTINKNNNIESKKGYENEDIFDGNSTESPLRNQQIINKYSGCEIETTPKKRNYNNSFDGILNDTITNKINSDASTSSIVQFKTEPTTSPEKRKRASSEENFNIYLTDMVNMIKTEMESNKTPVKYTNDNNDFCTPNKTIRESLSVNESTKVPSTKRKTTSETSSVSVSSNRKSSLSETTSLTDSMADIMSRVLSKKTDLGSFINEEKRKAKTPKNQMTSKSTSVDNSIAKIVARVLSNKTESPQKITSKNKTDTKSMPSESNSLNDLMADVMAKVLSKKTSPNKKNAAKAKLSKKSGSKSIDASGMENISRSLCNNISSPSVVEGKIEEESSRKSSLSDSYSMGNSMASIRADVLSEKIKSPKKKTTSQASSVGPSNIKAKSSRKSTPSESSSLADTMENIMLRVLSEKTLSSEKKSVMKSSRNNTKSNSISSASLNENDLNGLDFSLAQILAKVHAEKLDSIIGTNDNKNLKKRKISNSDSDNKFSNNDSDNNVVIKPAKKLRKSNNSQYEGKMDFTVDNNEISFDDDSFTVPLSSTKIESVKKKKNVNGKLK